MACIPGEENFGPGIVDARELAVKQRRLWEGAAKMSAQCLNDLERLCESQTTERQPKYSNSVALLSAFRGWLAEGHTD